MGIKLKLLIPLETRGNFSTVVWTAFRVGYVCYTWYIKKSNMIFNCVYNVELKYFQMFIEPS